jgi:streptogramin lyase
MATPARTPTFRPVTSAASSNFQRTARSSKSGASGAHALALDSAGRLFVCDRGNARLQIFNQDGQFLDQWTQFGRPSGLYIDRNDKLYVMDADSTSVNHPGWKKGIRIGSAKDGKVIAFVPGHTTDNPDGAAGEGIVADPAGNLYAAENTLRGVTKYVKLR